MALIGKHRWAVYYIQEDGEGGIEIRNHMDHNTKFDQYCVQMGQVISVDFEHSCNTLIAGTKIGYIQIWDMMSKTLLRRIRISD